MSWRHVFDCKVRYADESEAAKMACKCGYKFMAWNGDVLFVWNEYGDTAETGIKVAELLRFYESA